MFEYVAAVPLAQYDALVALVAEHGLLHDSVAVGRAGAQSPDADAVQLPGAAFADVGVVVFRAFFGVEVRAVVGRHLDPCRGIDGCGPYDGETVFGDLLQIGPVGDAHRGLPAGGCCEQRCGAQKKKAFHAIIFRLSFKDTNNYRAARHS